MVDCVFCRIASGEIPSRKVYEDDACVAFHDQNPQAPVHVLVIPRKHLASVAGLENAELAGQLVLGCNEVARSLGLDGEGYRLVTNHGASAGQSVLHLHWHVLGGRRMTWPPG